MTAYTTTYARAHSHKLNEVPGLSAWLVEYSSKYLKTSKHKQYKEYICRL